VGSSPIFGSKIGLELADLYADIMEFEVRKFNDCQASQFSRSVRLPTFWYNCNMNLNTILLVGTGGFFGSIARYVTVRLVDGKLNGVFPYGTLLVNVAGSFILGLIMGVIYKQAAVSNNWKIFLTTGFCGGFTTFSAFAFENVNLFEQKLIGTSVAYTLISIVLGVCAVFAGMMLGRIINN
jgi:CrcB protein